MEMHAFYYVLISKAVISSSLQLASSDSRGITGRTFARWINQSKNHK